MFKNFKAATFAIVLTLPAAAFASDSMDVDSDGLVTPEEFSIAFPDAPTGTFEQLDVNTDGALGVDEITAARESGILPDAS